MTTDRAGESTSPKDGGRFKLPDPPPEAFFMGHILEKMELSEDLLSMVINKGFCTKILGEVDLEGMVILVCYDDQVI